MNTDKYPRIKEYEMRKYSTTDKRTKNFPECLLCGEKSTVIVIIENSYMNGDDDVAYVCKEHSKTKYHQQVIERKAI